MIEGCDVGGDKVCLPLAEEELSGGKLGVAQLEPGQVHLHRVAGTPGCPQERRPVGLSRPETMTHDHRLGGLAPGERAVGPNLLQVPGQGLVGAGVAQICDSRSSTVPARCSLSPSRASM